MSQFYYTYYSYEEFGRGYIGKRSCSCNPEEDVKYFGSYKDKTFKPTQKIILEIYDTSEEAIADEIKVQRFFKVVENSHFANQAYQTSTKFSYIPSTEKAVENGKKSYRMGLGAHAMSPEEKSEAGKKGGKKAAETNRKNKTGIFGMTSEQRSHNGKKVGNMCKENKKGVCGLSFEQLSENGKKYGKIGGKKASELKVGVHALTLEQKSENGKKASELKVGVHALTSEQLSQNGKIGGKKASELKVGVHALTLEQRSENGRKSGQKNYEKGVGIHALTLEQRSENGKIGGSITAEKRSKEFALISSEGEIVIGKNIRKFCRENKLDRKSIGDLLNGILHHHKGWRKYISDKITILDFL